MGPEVLLHYCGVMGPEALLHHCGGHGLRGFTPSLWGSWVQLYSITVGVMGSGIYSITVGVMGPALLPHCGGHGLRGFTPWLQRVMQSTAAPMVKTGKENVGLLASLTPTSFHTRAQPMEQYNPHSRKVFPLKFSLEKLPQHTTGELFDSVSTSQPSWNECQE